MCCGVFVLIFPVFHIFIVILRAICYKDPIFVNMFTVVIIMAAGMLAGYLLRRQKKLISLSEKLVMWAIYLLLFLLGVAIGVNDQILERFADLGLLALAITFGGVAGSIFMGWVVFSVFFREKKVES